MSEERISLILEGKEKVSGMFDGVGGAITAFNQGLEIAKKGMELFRTLVLDNVKAMVEYRGELDPVARQLKQVGLDAQYTRAVIFDLLTPVILGLGDAFQSTGNFVVEYVNKNRALLATNITTFLADTARILVEGVAQGLTWASRAVSGLIEGWNLLSAGVETAIGGMLGGIETVIEAMADFAEWADDPALANTWRNAATEVGQLGRVFSESADESIAKVEAQIAKQKEFELALQQFKAVAVDFVGQAEVAILDRIAEGWEKVRHKTIAATDAVRNQREAYASLEPSIADLWQREADLYEQMARHLDAQQQAMAQNAVLMEQAAADVSSMWMTAFAQMASGSVDAMTGISRAVIQTAITAVRAAVASTAAQAAFSQAGIPILGPALAVGAATAMGAFVEGLLSQIPKAALGGVAMGGVPGRDSIGVLVQHEEGVLRGGQTALFQRLGNQLERIERGGQAAVVGNKPNVSISLSMQALDVSEPETKKKMLLGLATELEELINDNMMLSNLQRKGA